MTDEGEVAARVVDPLPAGDDHQRRFLARREPTISSIFRKLGVRDRVQASSRPTTPVWSSLRSERAGRASSGRTHTNVATHDEDATFGRETVPTCAGCARPAALLTSAQ